MKYSEDWYQRLPVVVMLLVTLSASLFFITYLLTAAFHRHQRSLADKFYSAGQAALASSQPNSAIEDFHTALLYAPTNDSYRFRLAQALASAGRNKEAQSHFMSLWENEPGDGEINLELARLSVRMDNQSDASRYFHAAIYGVWPENPNQHHREARLELSKFLLDHKQFGQAESELIALAADTPKDFDSRLELGQLFEEAGDPNRALQQFQAVLTVQPDDRKALLGAARCSFDLRDYRRTVSYGKRAESKQPPAPEVQQMVETSQLVLESDPFQRGLPLRERARRTVTAFLTAGKRLQDCAQSKQMKLDSDAGRNTASANPEYNLLQADYAQWKALEGSAQEKSLRRNPDNVEPAIDLALRIEADTEKVCGAPAGRDLALLLMSHNRSGVER